MEKTNHVPAHFSSPVELFTGPMFSEKTLRLIAKLLKFLAMGTAVVCLRPKKDTRHKTLMSRTGIMADNIPQMQVDTRNLALIAQGMHAKTVIGFDEIQMFEPETVILIEQAVRRGCVVLAAGIDTDFRGVIFPSVQMLMALPECKIRRERAICSICKEENATRSQRLRRGAPVPYTDPIELIDGADSGVTYEPRCILHHMVPGRPE